MATTSYYEKLVTDSATDEKKPLEVGTTGFGGDGPQMFINLDGKSVILSHKEAKKFASAVAEIARHFNY